MPTEEKEMIGKNNGLVLAVLIASYAVAGYAAEETKTTTTAIAADAKKREGKTGTSNVNAAKQLEALEAEEKKAPAPAKKSQK